VAGFCEYDNEPLSHTKIGIFCILATISFSRAPVLVSVITLLQERVVFIENAASLSCSPVGNNELSLFFLFYTLAHLF
jgi:hypothetical protein